VNGSGTFAVITVPSNELVGQIHDRMPAIVKPKSYDRWLGASAKTQCPPSFSLVAPER
jgi:putative SOS response-associated peptidase YedK